MKTLLLINNVFVDFFKTIKDFFIDVYNAYYKFVSGLVGENFATLVTVGIAFLIIFALFMAFMKRND